MTPADLWYELFAKDVRVQRRGDRLVIDAPRGVLDESLKEQLRAHKQALLSWLDTPPLSFAQERMWVLQQLHPTSSAYNVPLALRVRGPLDVRAMAAAAGQLRRRHHVLRARYRLVDGLPSVEVVAANDDDHGVIDIPKATTDDELAAYVASILTEPFDLGEAAPWRLRLLRLDARDHLLVLCTHHIACDGWSVPLLFRDLAELYKAAINGAAAELSPLPMSYTDYARIQRIGFERGEFGGALAYWMAQFANPAPPLELPTDRHRPAQPTYAGGVVRRALSADLADRARERTREARVTPFIFLLSSFVVMLQRLTGQRDIVVGTAVSNRDLLGSEELVGTFANDLALRFRPESSMTLRELLDHVRDVVFDAYEHQALPFALLVQELGPRRDLGANALYQVMFVVQNAPRASIAVEDVEFEAYPFQAVTSRLDLSFQLTDQGAEGMQVAAEYASPLFGRDTVESFVSAYARCLLAAVERPEIRLRDVDVFDPRDIELAVGDWGTGPTVDVPAPDVRAWFERACATWGDSPALIDESSEVSFSDLRARVRALAGRLSAMGAGPERVVAIYLPRSMNFVISMLAVLEAGAAFLPIDPAYPMERVHYMIADSGAMALIGPDPQMAKLGIEVPTIDPTRTDRVVAHTPASPTIYPESLAYVIYTSGSTGRPKGVLVEHRGIPNLVQAQIRVFGLQPGDVALQFAGLGFDAVVSEVFTALLSGASLCLLPPETIAPSEPLAKALRDWKVSVVTLPPSTAAMIDPASLPDLRTLICAGEACSAEVVRGWLPGRRFVNAYGPTEGTVCTSMAEVVDHTEAPPIGRVIDNARAYVLDGQLRPQPRGVWGELYVGGMGIARGYCGRAGLTAERFVPDPWSTEHGRRLYRTGDRVRWRADGQLEFAGRLDHQVKVRGHRIELGEVESMLRSVEGIADAAVVAYGEGPARRLSAFVILAAQSSGASHVRVALQSRLPAYMMPSVVQVLDALPQTANGKVDRRRLLELLERSSTPSVAVEVKDEVERAVLQIMSRVLEHELNADVDFFDAGGQSLLAAKLVTLIRQEFGVDITLAEFLRAPTVAAVAARVRSNVGSPRDRRCLIPLRGRVAGSPLVLVHPLGGELASYLELVPLLDPIGSVLGLRALTHRGEPIRGDLAAMTQAYADALDALPGEQPVALAGWSIGAIVAAQLAATRMRRGVGCIMLIDPRSELDGAPSTVEQGIRHFLAAIQPDASDAHARPLDVVLRELEAAGLIVPGVAARGADWAASWLGEHARVRDRFQPPALDMPVLLIQASMASRTVRQENLLSWQGSARLSHHVVEGDHASLLRRPAVAEVAKLISSFWQRHTAVDAVASG